MRRGAAVICLLFLTTLIVAQTQTTGAISGTVKDQNGGLITGANVTVVNKTTREARVLATDASGTFTASFLSPGIFRIRTEANGFKTFSAENVVVNITETAVVEITLAVAGIVVDDVVVEGAGSLVRTDTPMLGRTIDSRVIAELPLPTRTFTQLIGLVPGATTYLNDPTNVGRNTQSISVNGSRPAQNNFQINGVDANAGVMRDFQFGDPAPESIAEIKVQTSMYDATFGRAGGGSIQVVTKGGSNEFHGGLYEYFGDASLNANNPFLKAAGQPRPVLSRNVYGGTVGGPIKKDRVFFFASFQGTRERNGASPSSSLRTGVFIAQGLTDDRSEAKLISTFGVSPVHPTALRLLNARLPDGRFVIPTPRSDGLINFSEISRFREEQFNANLDFRISKNNWLSLKFFYSKTPETLAFASVNIPGFGEMRDRSNAIASIQDIQTFSTNVTNEARIGYNLLRDDTFLEQPLLDTELNIRRSTAIVYPGLPRIAIGPFAIGSAQREDKVAAPSASVTDTLSIRRGRHALRVGGEIRYYEFNLNTNLLGRGSINFPAFENFLTGITGANTVVIGNGIPDRALRTIDYNLFVQDDWKIAPKLTLNLGVRYELDPPFYDTRGRIATFDPLLYRPRMQVTAFGNPIGPPIGGIVQAGNAIAEYDLADVPNVGKRVVKSLDPNNFGPRVGFAYSPFKSNSVVFRGGYGIFYSRASFQYTVVSMFFPPAYNVVATSAPGVLNDPFPSIPSQTEFPGIFPGALLFGTIFDRNLRTPYIQQFNASAQFSLSPSTLFEAAYVGTRGLNLFRQSLINQAYLASPQNPIRNAVTGSLITTNTPANAQLRAPFQGASVGVIFTQNQTVAQSTYHSLQASLSRRLSAGLQFLASYTFSKSIDNGSGIGGGAGVTGTLTSDFINDTSAFDGDQRDNRSNRGVSDFDRTHRFVFSYVWDLPKLSFAKSSKIGRAIFSGWQMSGIVTAMSGLPINIRDSRAAELFYGLNGGGDRPSWAPGATRSAAATNIPAGYYFNPFAFVRPVVTAGQPIPSSNGTAFADIACPRIGTAFCTDFGTVGRNPLRGPDQFNVDLSITKRFRLDESKNLEFRAEAFNLLNNVNFANPISNFNVTATTGGSIDQNTGRITRPGEFGKIISTSNNPRLIQLVLKLNF